MVSLLGVLHLQYCEQFWAGQYNKAFRKNPKKGHKDIEGSLEGKPYELLLRSLGLFTLEKGRLMGDPIAANNFLMGLLMFIFFSISLFCCFLPLSCSY